MKTATRLEDIECLPQGLRQYTSDDVIAMQEIFNETAETGVNSPVLRPVSVEEMDRHLAYCKNSGLPVYVMEREGEIAGWLALNRFCWATEACGCTGEMSIYIKQAYIGRGLGRSLAQACVHLARERGLEALVGWVMAENYASQALMERLGFQLWSRLPKIARFGDKRQDVLIFGYHL